MRKKRGSAGKAARRRAAGELDHLVDALCVRALVEGDAAAAAALVSLAGRLTVACSELVDAQPTLARVLARGRVNWPVLFHMHPTMTATNLKPVAALPLGENTAWCAPRKRKAYGISKGVNRLVLDAMHAVAALDDPPPSFDAVWDYLERRTQGSPEKDPTLLPLGLPFARKQLDTAPKGTRSYETNIRDGIRQRMRTAYRTLLRNPKV